MEESFWSFMDSLSDLTNTLLLLFFATRMLIWLGRMWFSSQAPAPQAGNPAEQILKREALEPRKCLSSAYVLLLIAGPFGGHHYYLERFGHALTATWTLNFFGFGWLLDLFLLPVYVRSFNKRCTLPSAPNDDSRRRLLLQLPIALLCITLLPLATFSYGPRTFYRLGLVDIDRLAAQTEVNPYETLGLGRGASLNQAKSAYRALSLKWHPDRNIGCGKACERKMAEIGKAFEQIKKRTAPQPADRTWEGWFMELVTDWTLCIEAVGNWADDYTGAAQPPQAQDDY